MPLGGGPMWLLLIIVSLPGGTKDVVLETYRTEQQCGVEKVRIELEMHRAYPQEHDYRLVCRKKLERA